MSKSDDENFISIEDLPDGMMVSCPRGYVLSINSAACEILFSLHGLPETDALTVTQAFQSLHGRLAERGTADQIVEALLSASAMAYSDRLACLDGTIVERTTKPLENGERRLWILRDITDMQRAQSDRALHESAIEEEQARMAELAEQLFHAKAELEQKQAELTRLANTDSMTGLLNRRRFMDIAGDALSTAKTQDQVPTNWVLMFDIDHFKRINDSFGHGAGDEAIRDIARILSSVMQPQHHVARLGGEEFAVFMENTDMDEAIRLAEEVRAETSKHTTVADGVEIRFTISAGAAPWHVEDRSIDETLVRADKALYSAKAYGRNRVVAYEELPKGSLAAQ